jgi:hypothetical protein
MDGKFQVILQIRIAWVGAVKVKNRVAEGTLDGVVT